MKRTTALLSILFILSLLAYQPVFSLEDQPTQPTGTVATTTTATEQPVQSTTTTTQPTVSADSTFHQNYGSQDESKKTVDLKLASLDSPLTDMAWCGSDKKVIFFFTGKGSLYRSRDEGFTGHLLSEHLHKIGKKELVDEAKEEVGQVTRMIQNPADNTVFLFMGSHGVNWITEDCGETFTATNHGRHVEDFQFHPTERSWLLAFSWTIKEDFEDEDFMSYKEVFVSQDLGKSWDFVAGYVHQAEWAMYDRSFFKTPKERILMAYDPKAKGNQHESGWKASLRVAYSDDFFKTSVTLVNGGNQFFSSINYLFVVQAEEDGEYGKKNVTLYIGDPRQKEYKLRELEIPTKRLLDHGYMLLDASEHSVFLHIDHFGPQAGHGHIYISDSTGVRFSLALKNNVRGADGQCDFHKLEGIEGIYLANVYDDVDVKKFDLDNNMKYRFMATGGKQTQLTDFKKTVISFDKGAIWQPLTPPLNDSTGKRITCTSEEECALHLHSLSNSNFGPFYSTASSLGIIIATGNVGAYLSTKPDEINTYLSRDAGLTWYEIAKGSHTYEIGDHGGLIVIVPNQNGTKEVFYTWDQGLTWEALKISDTLVQVSNILMEPSNTGEKFIVYGRGANEQKGVVAALDFTTLEQRVCALPDQPDSPDSDFESWTPNGKMSPKCLLGRQTTYTRRKRDAKCYNNELWDKWMSSKPCECTEEDWECDFGYARDGKGPCLPVNAKFQNQSSTPPEDCSSYYYITQGYRKVAADMCKGGVNHEPIQIACPGTGLLSSRNVGAALGLAGFAMLFMWLNDVKNSERVKGQFDLLKIKVKKIFGRKDPAKEGYSNQIPSEDVEHNFSSLRFEDEGEEETGGFALDFDDGAHRRTTEREEVDTSRRQMAFLSRPESKKWIDDIRGC